MHERHPALTRFLESLQSAVVEQAAEGSRSLHVMQSISAKISQPGNQLSSRPATLPACSYLDQAIDLLQRTERSEQENSQKQIRSSVIEHALALKALSPDLAWWQRPDCERHGEPFTSGHANAMIIGKKGLEESDDVTIGVSLLSPGIRYPEHHHAPEEIYLVLSAGQWQKDRGAWYEPGPGGLVHHQPNVLHAMRSDDKPLLATWCLINE